ncbi:iron-containing alcohol dehydrogenase [Actinosynnema sp. NPDC047251]|uniref:Alcohol dehydrogenase iron-type/glycerol dehydrogenase GldA domain-containing protein n=1 Tax=Saccharothrix espanaensis (strain ATCC 51144 / DSM 44229 / JCM 9112 / NBRC 15066 / NRRL 15764) TaxID=1179773 RepID=K0JXP1_SACES|nr:iron-containing alcohol dehydrogenase [Saccharothrix espanaensis]CCH32665.1 hypothetical protein BN6_54060 [Saccharothrix espanaensis DSM 44229]
MAGSALFGAMPSPVAVHAGRDAIAEWAARARPGPDTLVVADPAAARAHPVIGELAATSARCLVPSTAGHGELVAAIRAHGVRRVVAIGGGSVLDAAKIAVALAAGCEPRYGGPARSGLGLLSAPRRTGCSLVAVPTTIGTGSETSAVARLLLPDGRSRLLVGPALRPSGAVVDPVLTSSLPRDLLASGALEVLVRLLGPVLGPHPLGGAGTAWCTGAARLVRDRADRLLRHEPGTAAANRLRLSLSLVSAGSQQAWSLLGRSPFAFHLWYLADAAAAVAGVTKMRALAWLFPTYAQWASREPGWGEPHRARRALAAVSLGSEAAGSASELRDWGVPRQPLPGDPGTFAEAALASWRRALTGLDAGRLRAFFGAVADGG